MPELGLPEIDIIGSVADVLRGVGLILRGQLVALLDESVRIGAESLGGSAEGVRRREMVLKEKALERERSLCNSD